MIKPTPPRARSAKYSAKLVDVLRAVFETGVDRSHDDAVLQRREPEVEGFEQEGELRSPSWLRMSFRGARR